VALAEVELRAERDDNARGILKRLLDQDKSKGDDIVTLGWSYVKTRPLTAFMCIETVVDSKTSEGDYATAAAMLQEYVARATTQVPALLKLVELCVDGGLESTMYDAQAQLCDAYLAGGQSAEARVIAEDLVAREPWERGHIERFRQALVMQKVSDPDSIIAERLSGQSPFLATDHFAPLDLDEPAAAQPASPTQTTSQTASVAIRGAAAPSEETEVDLTSVFASTPAQPPADVFKGKRAQDGEDPGEQLKLARTYLDTGMPEEAIGALQSAALSPRHRFEAASTLARLYARRGDFGKAVEWFERAAEAPAPTTDAGRALLYDLGVALEASGEIARALAVFLELQADADRYRDVQARIERLSRVQTGG